MATDPWTQAVTALYLVCNGSRLLAYAPQIAALVRTRQADGVSVGAWLIFAVAHASTAAYAFEMGSDAMLVWYGLANMALSLTVAALAACAQSRKKRDSAPIGGSAFYSASYGSGGVGERVDAPFLDAVARDQGQAVRLQFRPLGLAAGVGVRAARMERAA